MPSLEPIVRSEELRAANRGRVLVELRQRGGSSRAELGAATGLSAAAISSFAAELVADGIVATARAAVARGRPRSILSLRADAATAVTVSLSIDRLEAALLDYGGNCRNLISLDLDTRSLDADGVISQVTGLIERLLEQESSQGAPGSRLRHVSVGFQGLVEPDSGTLVWSPILGAADVPLGAALAERFEVSVSVNNDCRLIAEALHLHASDRLGENFATVLFSHGVGLALVLGGQPFSGVSTSALELGHLRYEPDGSTCRCGRHGCIEAYCADYAIMRSIERARGDAAIAIGRIDDERIAAAIEAALRGESAACTAFSAAGSAIGTGLAQLFLLLGPMPVALVGRTSAALSVMRPSLERAMAEAAPANSSPTAIDLEAFPEDEQLLRRGLTINALAGVDQQLARAPGPSAALATALDA